VDFVRGKETQLQSPAAESSPCISHTGSVSNSRCDIHHSDSFTQISVLNF
jgi:hypothetical protein